MKRTIRLSIAISAFALAAAMPPAGAHADLMTADEIASRLGFPDSDKQKVLDGEFVSRNLESSNERELAVAMAFFVPLPVEAIAKQARNHVLDKTDPETIKFADISGSGTLADFDGLDLAPDPGKRAKAYLNAEAGSDLNLSTAEIAEFQALKVPDGGSAETVVSDAVKKQLLARHQAYVSKGLAGIAPYDRGGSSSPAGDDLKSASETMTALKAWEPDFYNALVDYPAAKAPNGNERFTWSNYKAHGEPVFILTHTFGTDENDRLLIASRQYYVSGSYNVGQAVIAVLPVKGGSVAFYVNRTSTDQVTGFGGGTKKSMGGKVMASQLKKLYAEVRKNLEKGAK